MTLCKAIAYQGKKKKPTTKNVSHKKRWRTGEVQIHVESP